jgi:hypothetical protein
VKTFFPSLNKGYVKHFDHEDHLLNVTPRDLNGCIALAKEAVELSRFKDKRSKQLWKHVIDAARSLNVDFRVVAETRLATGKTILETCIEVQDWDSCREFVFALPEGRYCDNRVSRKGRSLILDEDVQGKQKGIIVTSQGFYYAGDLRSGQKDGNGILTSMSDCIFEGEWKNNQRHGWGVYREINSQRISHEGLFIEGSWIGNPHQVRPTKPSGIRNYFFK